MRRFAVSEKVAAHEFSMRKMKIMSGKDLVIGAKYVHKNPSLKR
jgi:hypothetical protein